MGHSRRHIAKTQKPSEEQGEKTQLKYSRGNKAQVTWITLIRTHEEELRQRGTQVTSRGPETNRRQEADRTPSSRNDS